jgi:hypothetical protein
MDPDQTLNPNPSSVSLRMLKSFYIFFSYNLPQAHYLQSILSFWVNFCVTVLCCKHFFSQLNTFMRKGKDLGPDPDPYL